MKIKFKKKNTRKQNKKKNVPAKCHHRIATNKKENWFDWISMLVVFFVGSFFFFLVLRSTLTHECNENNMRNTETEKKRILEI